MSAFEDFAATWRPKIDVALDSAVSLPDAPDVLREAMRYSLLLPGKRIRPLLVLLSADACGGSPDDAISAAVAIELVHCYSLIHDDLPAMDDDDLRRGKPTNHKVYGEAQAILAGDALLTLAFEVLSQIAPAEKALACINTLAESSGHNGMVGGQSDDLSAEGTVIDLPMLQSIHHRKTGALIRASVKMGAIMADALGPQKDALREYATALGMLFQITDDLLDVTGSEESVGKKVGKDAEKGKATYPGLLGIEESRALAKKLTEESVGALKMFDEKADPLRNLAQQMLARMS